MIAAEDIPRLHEFSVEGVNWVNPVTLEDCGWRALFCARRDIAAGEVITPDDYHPHARAAGMYQNVTREPLATDKAELWQWGKSANSGQKMAPAHRVELIG